MRLPVENLNPETFAAFGVVIERPTRATDAAGEGWQWWGEIVQLAGEEGERRYAVGYLDLTPADLRFDWAECHMRTDELIIPLDSDCLVYVGPPEYLDDPARLPPFEHFRVFLVRQGQAVLLKPGVWHGAPLAVKQPVKALVLLLHGTGQHDVYIQRFEDTPIAIQP